MINMTGSIDLPKVCLKAGPKPQSPGFLRPQWMHSLAVTEMSRPQLGQTIEPDFLRFSIRIPLLYHGDLFFKIEIFILNEKNKKFTRIKQSKIE